MSPLTRRQTLWSAGASLSVASGLPFVPRRVSAGVTVTEFSATDDAIITSDGTVRSIWATPHVEIEWEGFTDGADLTIEIWVKNIDSSETALLIVDSESNVSTTGSRSVSFDPHDILETDVFSATDFTVDEPGTTRETDIEYELTVTGESEDETLVVDQQSTKATVTVERIPGPDIQSVALDDDSNPARTRVTVSWAVSDEFEVDAVTSKLRFQDDDTILDSETTETSGYDVSGEHELDVQETSTDDYVVTVVAVNEHDVSSTVTQLESGRYENGESDVEFSTLTAVVSATQQRANTSEPTQVTFEYAFEDDYTETVEYTIGVSNSAESTTSTGSNGTVVIDIDPGGPPEETASVSVVRADGSEYSKDITVDDGEVDLLAE